MSRRELGERRGVSPTWLSYEKRLLRRTYASTLAFILLLAVGVPVARAAEPHLEFVRGLQARGMADLAADYMQRLSANPPENLKAILPLELARARLEQASQEGDDKKRANLFAAARRDFEAFLSTTRDAKLTARANLELARLVSAQGKQKLVHARRLDAAAARKDLTAQARPFFADAARRLQDSAAQIDAQVRAATDPAERRDLTRALGQARLEEGINLLHQGVAMPDTTAADIKARAAVIGQAKEILSRLGVQDNEDPVSWSARVWVGRCAEELDSKPEARRIYETVAGEKSDVGADAARAASYLLLRLQARDEQVPNRPTNVQKLIQACDEWLTRYKSAAQTPDGQGMRYLLAGLLEEQAFAGVRRDDRGIPATLPPASRLALTRAERIYRDLIETENEFTDRARGKRAGVLVALMGERARDNVARLTNFEECYLAAQVAAFELTQGRKPAAVRTALYRRVIDALKRGLLLAGPVDAPRDLAEARVMLTYAYLASGDPYSAAVLGEHLGRTLASGRGAEATAYALQGYASIIALDRERGASPDEVKADQRRLRQLAEAMERTWPDEAATDYARHQLADFLLEDGQYVEACAMLARIAPTYPGFAQARYQLGAAAQKAQGKILKLSPQQKQALLAQAIAALEPVPDPVPGAGEESNLAATLAKLQLGTLLLMRPPDARNYDTVETLGRRLAGLIPQLELNDKATPQLVAEAAKLHMTGTEGKAYLHLKAARPADARKLLDPLVAQIRKELEGKPPAYAEEPWFESYRDVQRQMLLIALRADIMDNQTPAARQVLDTLRKATADKADLLNERLLEVVTLLKQDTEALKAKSGGGREQLEKGLVAFLDDLAAPDRLAVPETRLFVAQAYSNLERHDKAAALLKAFPRAKDGDPAQQTARYAELLYVRELRLSKEYKAAKDALEPILKGWGKTDLNARREAVLVLEDEGSYAGAVRIAQGVQQQLSRSRAEYDKALLAETKSETEEQKATTDEARTAAQLSRQAAQQAKERSQNLRERYWEFYFYEVRCVVKNDLKPQYEKERDQRMAKNAKTIVNLEHGQEDFGGRDLREKYRELVVSVPALKKAYSEQGGRKLLGN
jgi:hypothetical protein